MKKEAILYDRHDTGEVTCRTCQRRCLIHEGKNGWCRSRLNDHGTLYSLIYGEISARSVNPIEKKPVYHFLPGSRWLSLGSVGCNFRCTGCQNWNIAHWKGGAMGTEYLSPEQAINEAKVCQCSGISWTFNEPAIWFEYTLYGAKCAKAHGLYTNYVTNGTITEEALYLIAPFLDVYRVDIKAFSSASYQKIGHTPEFRGILDTTQRAKREHGMHVEVVTNIIPGYNDSDAELGAIAKWINEDLGVDTPWHVTRFYPACSLGDVSPTPIATLERAWALGKEAGLCYVYLGNVPGHRWENTYCHRCDEILIERYGFDVVKNNVRDGQCPKCGARIPGVF